MTATRTLAALLGWAVAGHLTFAPASLGAADGQPGDAAGGQPGDAADGQPGDAAGGDGGATIDADALPETWRELPGLARAAERAVREKVAGKPPLDFRSRAFGDPAAGGFAWLGEVTVPGKATGDLTSALTAALTRAGFTVTVGSSAGADGGVWFDFSTAEWRGQIRVVTELAAPDRVLVTAVACFYNSREPAITAGQCGRIMRRSRR